MTHGAGLGPSKSGASPGQVVHRLFQSLVVRGPEKNIVVKAVCSAGDVLEVHLPLSDLGSSR